jgi:hypothetical protein
MLIVQLRLACLMVLAALLAGAEPNLGGIVALTVATICVAVAVRRFALGGEALAGPSPVRRARATEVLYLRHAHPDAEGHPRPRAPGAA